jgi:hypothetical protein
MKAYGINIILEKLNEANMTGLILPHSSRIPLSWGTVKDIGDNVNIGCLSIGDKVLYVTAAATKLPESDNISVSKSYIFAKENKSC